VIPLGGIEPGSQSQVVHDLVHQNGVLGSKLGIEVEFDSPHLHQSDNLTISNKLHKTLQLPVYTSFEAHMIV